MSPNHLAFLIGLFGSVHCIGMCGPLAFAVPVNGSAWWSIVFDKLLYQFGRIISYILLGVFVGLLGRQLWLAGLQQWVSILSGLLIIMAACSRIFKLSVTKNSNGQVLKYYNKIFGYALKHKANHLIIGVLNGFLPCGFVYLALADAVNLPSIPLAATYMFWFGMGTLPLMFIASVSMAFAGFSFRSRINRAIPYVMLCLGIWFVLRGMELNVPYLSPPKAASTIDCN